MTEAGTPEGNGEESGSALREKLETEIAAKTAAESTARELAAQQFKHVSPADLAGVPLGDLITKGQELEQAAEAQRQQILADALAERGLSPEKIAEMVGDKPASQTSTETQPQSFGSLATAGNLGTPQAPPTPGAGNGVFGESRILAAMGD